jgi:glutathionylspermidine synthase
MCVYVILRVLEKDEDVTDFDIPLIYTIVVRMAYVALLS